MFAGNLVYTLDKNFIKFPPNDTFYLLSKNILKNRCIIGKFAIQCTDYEIYILFFTLSCKG